MRSLPGMKFLSAEWAEIAQEALRRDPAFAAIAAQARIRIWIVPTRRPDWADEGTLAVDHGEITLRTGKHGRADAVGTASYDTWLQILRHELHPTVAVVTGKLRGRGVRHVVGNRGLLDTMLDVFRAIPVDG